MPSPLQRWPQGLALAASVLGLAFGMSSALDYASHLDRQLHDIHCGFIPGLGATSAADTGCRVAMYSPYAALFRDRYWGGIPIALFAVGAFAFFAAFSLYLLLAHHRAPKRAAQFFLAAGTTPFLASAVMAAISALRLGTFCQTCIGIYISSAALLVASIAYFAAERRATRRALETKLPAAAIEPPSSEGDKQEAPESSEAVPAVPQVSAGPSAPETPRTGGFLLIPVWLMALGLCAIAPAFLYVSALPNYANYVSGCGKLAKPAETTGALLRITPPRAKVPATLFVDPLCPTCKALHKRLDADGVLDKLDITLVLFPLDNECNWMLDRALHPGSCVVSKAILCSEHRAMQVLDWAYDHQEELLADAKAGAGIVNVRARIRENFPGLEACIESKDTSLRLNRMLRYIVNNQLPVSTPQMFLAETRVCDEDTDMGLTYTLNRIAPSLLEAR